jgi:hypothetical protein
MLGTITIYSSEKDALKNKSHDEDVDFIDVERSVLEEILKK